MTLDQNPGFENEARDIMIRQLRQNLAKCRKVLLDEKLDLKTRERWTQLYNNTSTVLNRILKDRQMRDWENRMREIEEYQETGRLPGALPPVAESSRKDEHGKTGNNESTHGIQDSPID